MKPQKHFPKKQLDLVVLVKYAVKVILEAGKCTTSTNRRLQHAIRPRPKNWNLASLPPLGTLRGSSAGPLKLSKSHLSHLHSQDATVKFWPLLDKDTCNGKKNHQHSAALRQNASAFRLCIYSKSNAYKKYI